MKLSFDTPVIFEVEGCVEASAFDLLRDIVRVCEVEHTADLQDSSSACRGDCLGVKAGSHEAEETDPEQELTRAELSFAFATFANFFEVVLFIMLIVFP